MRIWIIQIMVKKTSSFKDGEFVFWAPFEVIFTISDGRNFFVIWFFFVLSILPGTSHFIEFWSFQVQSQPWKIDLSASISNLEVKLEVGKQFEVFWMFSNNEFDYLTDNFRSSPILDNFRRLHPTWVRCGPAFAFPASPIVHAKIHVQRSKFSSHTSQPPANDIYVKCAFWWHVLFSTTVPWLYSKDDFRIAMIHWWAEKYVQMRVEAICSHVFLIEWLLIMMSLVSERWDHVVW